MAWRSEKYSELVAVYISKPLKKRFQAMLDYQSRKQCEFIRDAIIDGVKAHEAFVILEEQKAAAKKAEKKTMKLGIKPLVDLPSLLSTAFKPMSKRDEFYENLARYIMQAKDAEDKAYRVNRAVLTVEENAPLTCGTREEILAKLEGYILSIRGDKKPGSDRVYDEKVGKVVETDVPTCGDLPDEE